MKKIKKILCLVLICTLLSSTATVFAEEQAGEPETKELTVLEPVEDTGAPVPNKMDNSYAGPQVTVNGLPGDASDAAPAAVSENTDPANAYLVQNGSILPGAITAVDELRWYGFILNAKSKATIYLEMAAGLDADLYVFRLNTDTYELTQIGGSASTGTDYEYYTTVLDSGIYYFAVSGYSGTGNFALAYYESILDIDYELNDIIEYAKELPLNTDVAGVIDNPYDLDYYKVTLENAARMNYSMNTSSNYAIELIKADGASAKIYILGENKYIFYPGTYYFRVKSTDGSYSTDSPYTLNFTKLMNLSNDSTANKLSINDDAGIYFQSNIEGTNCYVNGHRINIDYTYNYDYSNSYGKQVYDISLHWDYGVFADVKNVSTIFYMNSTRPNLNIKNKDVIKLLFVSESPFYKIHCNCGGSYAQNYLWEDMKSVEVLIDPDTGKLVDIYHFNYFYDGNTIGSNKITCTPSYYPLTGYNLGN